MPQTERTAASPPGPLSPRAFRCFSCAHAESCPRSPVLLSSAVPPPYRPLASGAGYAAAPQQVKGNSCQDDSVAVPISSLPSCLPPGGFRTSLAAVAFGAKAARNPRISSQSPAPPEPAPLHGSRCCLEQKIAKGAKPAGPDVNRRQRRRPPSGSVLSVSSCSVWQPRSPPIIRGNLRHLRTSSAAGLSRPVRPARWDSAPYLSARLMPSPSSWHAPSARLL